MTSLDSQQIRTYFLQPQHPKVQTVVRMTSRLTITPKSTRSMKLSATTKRLTLTKSTKLSAMTRRLTFTDKVHEVVSDTVKVHSVTDCEHHVLCGLGHCGLHQTSV